jgi:osmotically-inducible protein OsmY
MKKLGLSIALPLAAVGAWFIASSRRRVVVGKIRGLATRVLERKEYDDATLKDKVESELFRAEHEVKGAININAQQGVVQLRGEVPSQGLIDALVERTEKIQGVREVESLLHTPGTEAPMHH